MPLDLAVEDMHVGMFRCDIDGEFGAEIDDFAGRGVDAEALRDALLATSGELNLKMGGPSFFPAMSPEALEGLSRKSSAWKQGRDGIRLMEALDFCIIDILERPTRWPWLGPYALRLRSDERRNWLNEGGDAQIAALSGRLEELIGKMPEVDSGRDVSSKYPLLVLRHHLRYSNKSRVRPRSKMLFWRRLEPILDDAISRAPALSRADVKLWLDGDAGSGSYSESKAAYAEMLQEFDVTESGASASLSRTEWNRIADRVPSSPAVIRHRIHTKLTPIIGESPAELVSAGIVLAVMVGESFSERLFDLRTRWQLRTRCRAALRSVVSLLAERRSSGNVEPQG